MLSLPPSVRVFAVTQPVDGRKGADSLMTMVRDLLAHDPLSGHLYLAKAPRRSSTGPSGRRAARAATLAAPRRPRTLSASRRRTPSPRPCAPARGVAPR